MCKRSVIENIGQNDIGNLSSSFDVTKFDMFYGFDKEVAVL